MDPIQDQKQQKNLSAAITTCLSLETEFKLFSYRIIPPDQFIGRCREIMEAFNLETDDDVPEINT